MQELLRHANSRITLYLYGQAGMAGKREAQRMVVEMVLKTRKGSGLNGPYRTMKEIADSLQVLEEEWRGRRDSNSRPLP